MARQFNSIAAQFRNLSLREVGNWPPYPKIALLIVIFAILQGIGWYLYWDPKLVELAALEETEHKLKEEYKDKMQQAINLEELKKQKEQVAQYVNALEKQLPSKAEMDALLSDINQAGIGRGLSFVLFRPGQTITKPYYAELPIQISVTGGYHDMGSFASDIANLSRIVTINDMDIKSEKEGLVMAAVAKTYRYLDAEEIAAQRRVTQGQQQGTTKAVQP